MIESEFLNPLGVCIWLTESLPGITSHLVKITFSQSVFSSSLMPDSQEFLAKRRLGLEKKAGGSNMQEDILRTLWICGSGINHFWWGEGVLLQLFYKHSISIITLSSDPHLFVVYGGSRV